MDLVQLISQVGFPIAVAAFLLIRFDTTIKENTKATVSLSQALRVLATKLKVEDVTEDVNK